MPRPRSVKSKSIRKVRIRRSSTSTSKNVNDYIQNAQEALESLDLESACNCYEEALLLDPTNSNLMDALADLKLQLGDVENATRLLEQSIALAPEVNNIKWMFLAQLCRGEKAAHCYRTGIRLQLAQLDSLAAKDISEQQAIRERIVSAYCGLAELYMTDLCYELNAEESCETAIMSALHINSESLEARQTLASLRISQCHAGDAASILAPIALRILESLDHYRARTLIDEFRAGESVDESMNDLPTPEVCIALTKLLLEVHKGNPEFVNNAQAILENVLALDDEQPEAWYLLGMVHLSKSPPDQEAADEVFNQCLLLLEELSKAGEGESEAISNLRQAVTVAMTSKQHQPPKPEDNSNIGAMNATASLVNQGSNNQILEEEDQWSTDDDMDTTS